MLRGNKVNLRLMKMSDLESYVEIFNDIEQRGEYYPLTILSVEKYKRDLSENNLWSGEHGTMMICDKSERVIGMIAFFKGVFYMEGFEIGYNIFSKNDRGKGYGTEALKLFTEYLFMSKKIERLELNLNEENTGSRRLAEKCGYKLEGLMRKAVFSRGRYEDLQKYAILREDWEKLPRLLIK